LEPSGLILSGFWNWFVLILAVLRLAPPSFFFSFFFIFPSFVPNTPSKAESCRDQYPSVYTDTRTPSQTIIYVRSSVAMPSIDNNGNEARLLLVSNRLPITIKRSEDGKYDFSMSSGGLVSGLSGLSKSTTFQWYGWPGLEVPEEEVPHVKERLRGEYGAVPVFIDDELADRHYNGFSS